MPQLTAPSCPKPIPYPPHRTVRAVLPHTALRCSSSTSIRLRLAVCGIASSEVLKFGRTAVLAPKGTRSSYPLWTCEQSNAPSLQQGYVVLAIISTMGVSDSSFGRPFRVHQVMVYTVGYVNLQRPEEVSPVPQPTLSTFRAPYTGGFFDAASPSSVRVFHRSSSHTAGLDSLLARLREYTLTMRQASRNVTDC